METIKEWYILISIIWFSASIFFSAIILWYAWYYRNEDFEVPKDDENIELNEKLFSLINFAAKELNVPFAYDNVKKEWVKASIP